MAKGYWVANSDVVDMDAMQHYRAANQSVLQRYGARLVVVSGRQRVAEGASRSRQTIVEFPSYDAAVAAYDDPEYERARAIRQGAASGDLVIVEGFEAPV